jgi:signal transduction histidine kinase
MHYQQALFNLLDNSLRYTEKGSIKVIIEEKGNLIYTTVQDSGSGIQKDTLLKI